MLILVSFAGGTDPVASNAYDGPLLHIVRHYRPDYVRLLLTREMSMLAEKDNRYEFALQWLCNHQGHKCRIESVKTDIQDAHNFDVFQNIVLKEIYSLKREYPGAEILFNISSGTPQITATLCLVAVSLGGIKAIQVATPAKAMNAGTKHVDSFDESIMENNLDNLESNNRCIEPDIMVFRKTMVASRLRELVTNYDYTAAWRLLREETDLKWSEKLWAAVCHGMERLNLRQREAFEQACLMPNFEAYPVQYKPAHDAVEYYLASSIKQHRGELGDFILRLSPLLQYLVQEYVQQIPGFRLSQIRSISNGVAIIKPEMIKQAYPDLYEHLCIEYGSGNGFRSTPVNSDILIRIALYYETLEDETGGVSPILQEFIRLRGIEKNIRNRLAHQMTAVTEKEISDTCGISSREMVKILQKLIVDLYKGHVKHEAFTVYERLNQYITEQLDFI